MSTFGLLLAEIRHRRLNFALSVVAVVVAVTLFVAAPALVDAYQRETQAQVSEWQQKVAESEGLVQAMKDRMAQAEKDTAAELALLGDETRKKMLQMGFNLLIVPEGTNMSDFWASDFADRDMPQEYIERLARAPSLTLVTHLVATLQRRIDWEGRSVLLTGYLPETPQAHMKTKKPMGYEVRPGTVLLGYELSHGRKVGDEIEVLGQKFQVARLLDKKGSKEDNSLVVHLSDAQALLNKPGRINHILALDCHCPGADLAMIRQQVSRILPDTQVTEFQSIRLARAEQRAAVAANSEKILAEMKENLQQQEFLHQERKQVLETVEESRAKVQGLIDVLADVITPLVVLFSAVWVGLLALANVRQRRTEIGLLRALGKKSAAIASLLLGKAALIGIAGAVVGVLLGAALAYILGRTSLGTSSELLIISWPIVLGALVGAPVVSILASYLPTLTAIHQDPAIVLREP